MSIFGVILPTFFRIRSISLYSVRMLENADQNNPEYGHFSRSATHLNYGCLVWSYSRKSNIDCLIKLQKRCIRIINFSEFDSHTDPQYSELKLVNVNDTFSLGKLLFMSDFIKVNIPEDVKRLFIFNKSLYSYETRFS